MTTANSLFVKYNGQICGPLRFSQVAAHIAMGGFKCDDLGSVDRLTWKPLKELVARDAIELARQASGRAVRPATRGRRMNAFLLDLVFNLVAMVIFAPFVFIAFVGVIHPSPFAVLTTGFRPDDLTFLQFIMPASMIVALLIFAAFQVLLLVRRGATVGKLLCGLRVVSFSLDGSFVSRLGFFSAFVRHGLSHSMFFVPPFGVIFNVPNFVMFLWKGARPLHDRLAGTCVVDRNEMSAK